MACRRISPRAQARRVAASAKQNSPKAANPAATTTSSDAPRPGAAQRAQGDVQAAGPVGSANRAAVPASRPHHRLGHRADPLAEPFFAVDPAEAQHGRHQLPEREGDQPDGQHPPTRPGRRGRRRSRPPRPERSDVLGPAPRTRPAARARRRAGAPPRNRPARCGRGASTTGPGGVRRPGAHPPAQASGRMDHRSRSPARPSPFLRCSRVVEQRAEYEPMSGVTRSTHRTSARAWSRTRLGTRTADGGPRPPRRTDYARLLLRRAQLALACWPCRWP